MRSFLRSLSAEDIVNAVMAEFGDDELKRLRARIAVNAVNGADAEAAVDRDVAVTIGAVVGRNVLTLLGILDEDGSLERERATLFVANADWAEGGALRRLQWMMRVYRRWIGLKEAVSAKSGRCGFVEAVNLGMGEQYGFTDLLADFQSILRAKEVLMDDERARAQSESASGCDAADCFILRRSEREKGAQKESDGAFKTWFFMDGDGGDFDDNLDDVVYQELLDSIHVFMDHTVRITPDELADAVKEEEDDEGYDHFAESICSILEKKKKTSSRFRTNRRGGVVSKFMTTTTTDSHSQPPPTTTTSTATATKNKTAEQEAAQNLNELAIYQQAVDGHDALLNQPQKQQNQHAVKQQQATKHREPSFMDALCAEIEAQALDHKETAEAVQPVISALTAFVHRDGADSDAVIEDLEDCNDSNILEETTAATATTTTTAQGAIHSVWAICQKFIAQTNGANDLYSSG